MGKDLVIRFGVGSRRGPKSGVWRVWVGKGKSDVYVAVRSYAGVLKVSLHETGECMVALTSQFAHRHPAAALATLGASRRFDKWKRVTHSGSQLSVPFRLAFPDSELRLFHTADDQDEAVRWIDAPPRGHSIDVACVFTGQCYAEDGWPLREQGAQLLARAPLPNGEALWILYLLHQTFGFVEEVIRRTREEMRGPGTVTVGDLDLGSPSARLVIPGVDSSGVRIFTDVALA